jgi:hypothetical protein
LPRLWGCARPLDAGLASWLGAATRLTAEIANAESRLSEIEGDFQKAETNLQRALARAGDCQAAYREATGRLRRQFNLAFFKRLLIDDDCSVTGELAEPFKSLLGDDLRRAAVAQESEELREAVETALRRRAVEGIFVQNQPHPREPERLLVGAGTPALSLGGGFSANIMVGATGSKSNHDFDADAKKIGERLIGALAAEGVRPPLSRLAEKLAALRSGMRPQRELTSCRQRPRRPGWVLNAVMQVLADRGEPMRAKDIHVAVEALVGEPVAWSSIKGALADHVSGPSPRFVRIARGRYVLA